MLSCRDKRKVNCNVVSDSGVVVSGGGVVVVWLFLLLLWLLCLLLSIILFILGCTCLRSACSHNKQLSNRHNEQGRIDGRCGHKGNGQDEGITFRSIDH